MISEGTRELRSASCTGDVERRVPSANAGNYRAVFVDRRAPDSVSFTGEYGGWGTRVTRVVSATTYNMLLRSLALAAAGLLIANISAARMREEVGILGRAQFRIHMPNRWNGSLVLWCGGYDSVPGSFRSGQPVDRFAQALLDEGYAHAESGYSAGGVAVNEAGLETEELRRYFSRKHGKPKQVFVVGESMGGLVALALVELHRANYNAGLAFCGMLSSPAAFLRRAFDLLALFAAYVPDILPPPGKVPPTYKPGEQLIKKVLQGLENKADGAAAIRSYAGVANNEELAGLLVFHTDALRDVAVRCGGNPFDNRSTLYSAGRSAAEVNGKVPRFEDDPDAATCMKGFLAPKGVLARPFLSLDAADDPVVPAWCGNSYVEQIAGTPAAPWFVRQFVPAAGHCSVPLEARLDAFRRVVTWSGDYKERPPSGLR